MDIQEKDLNGVTLFTVKGRVDSEGAVDLDLALRSAMTEGKSKMVLELSDVRYVNSSGLRTLADILTQDRAHGGDLKLANMNPKVLRVFQIIGFEKFFSIYPSVDDAVKSF
ncbi:MAG: anti-sigma factor antagonist [Chloroflexota bacterium]|nr:MAG: anti-sigma factor antagonist [Chloroflexota bacterium]